MDVFNNLYKQYRTPINYGLLAGLVLLFIGLVGMLEDFADREIIRDLLTLAQFLIYLSAFVGGYVAARKASDNGKETLNVLITSVFTGILCALPTLLLLFLSTQVFPDLNDIFVNVNRDWIEVITFDNRDNLVLGGSILLGIVTGFTVLGAIVASLPQKLNRTVLIASSITLLIGIFGETVGLILEQLLPDDILDMIFRRDVLKQQPALILLILSSIGAVIWSYGGETIQQNYKGLPSSSQNAVRYVGLAIVAAIFLLLPMIIGRALSDTAVTIGLFVLMGLGLNIAIGLAGLLDLGYVTNYAVGAYIMAVLTSRGPLGVSDNIAQWINDFNMLPFLVPDTFINFWIVLPIAIVAAMLTGFIFALPVLKMRGDYLAIATLGFGEIIGKLVISDWFSPVLGGPQGVPFVPDPVVFGYSFGNPEQMYYLVLAACLLTLFVSVRLNNSRIGRQWMAIREDEDVAEAMGINVARSKLLAFTLSAATGGLAGAIFAAKIGTVLPSSFTVFVSINVLSLIIVGGIGSNPGIFVGALVLIGMPELLREFSEYRFLLYGALLIFMMVNRPEGLWPSQVTKRELAGDDEDSSFSVDNNKNVPVEA